MENVGRNFESMHNFNRSLILRILSKSKTCTRSQLAKNTGLTQASISKIISGMIDVGVVQESGLTTGKLGRRSISISLNRDICKVLAVKIARRSFDVAVFKLGGELVEQHHQPLNTSDGPHAAIEEILQTARRYCDKYEDIDAIGVAVPGPYLRNQGKIAIMSEFLGWDKIDIRDAFSSEFDLPVRIEHDANASALAEWSYGTKNSEGGMMVSFLASEGIGAGIINNGAILQGVDGVAGEVGHMSIDINGKRCVCGNCGCLELYCSSLSFAKWVGEELKENPESSLNAEREITAEIIFEHMRSGDRFSIDSVKKVGRYIGCGMANIVYLYNPKEIVVTDIMTGGGQVLIEAAKDAVRERTLAPLNEHLDIRLTTLPYDTILMGAAALATETLLDQPSRLYKNDNMHRRQESEKANTRKSY